MGKTSLLLLLLPPWWVEDVVVCGVPVRRLVISARCGVVWCGGWMGEWKIENVSGIRATYVSWVVEELDNGSVVCGGVCGEVGGKEEEEGFLGLQGRGRGQELGKLGGGEVDSSRLVLEEGQGELQAGLVIAASGGADGDGVGERERE